MDIFFYAFVGLLFAAVILLCEAFFGWWASSRSRAARRIEGRLQAFGGQSEAAASMLHEMYADPGSPLLARLVRLPLLAGSAVLLRQSGVGWRLSGLGVRAAGCGLAAALAAYTLLHSGLLALLAFVPGALLPLLYLLRLRARRFKAFEQQLPEVADLLSRALRAGHAFPVALQMAGDEMPAPIGPEFRRVSDQINFGVPMNEALATLVEQVPLTDMRYFIIAVLIQRESGGNLSEILENISLIIRDRLKLFGRIRVLSAEGKLSAWILGCLPFALATVIRLVNPGYMKVLWTDPAGVMMLGAAGVLMAIGLFWMRNVIRIRV